MKNNNRKGTPDIMAGLMSSPAVIDQEQVAQQAIKQECNKAVFPNNLTVFSEPANHKAIKQECNKLAGKQVSNVEPLKEKTTFNLSLSTLENLDEAWIKLRRKLKNEQRITKTLIVEKAIEIALAELETKSELSDLYLKLKINTQ